MNILKIDTNVYSIKGIVFKMMKYPESRHQNKNQKNTINYVM